MSTSRINLSKAAPPLQQAVLGVEKLVSESMKAAGFPAGFAHLLRLRASQINGCAYCLRMHAKDALAGGETADRLAVLPAWRETTYFTPAERAALALVEAITLVADGQVEESVYAAAAAELNPAQIAAVEWLAVVINAWNRIAIASRYPVGP